MATGLLANPKMRQLFVIGIIVALILVMFVVMLVFGVTEQEEIINLEQKEFG
jgi:amino acid permease